MEIRNPKTEEFLPLIGAFNFDHYRVGQSVFYEFSFAIDWTKGGDGQDVLRDHIRDGSLMDVRNHGQEYRGKFKFEWGFNSSDGKVIIDVRHS